MFTLRTGCTLRSLRTWFTFRSFHHMHFRIIRTYTTGVRYTIVAIGHTHAKHCRPREVPRHIYNIINHNDTRRTIITRHHAIKSIRCIPRIHTVHDYTIRKNNFPIQYKRHRSRRTNRRYCAIGFIF